MKLKGLKLVNFAKFSNFEVEFNGDITNLYGINGAGKTTIGLVALQAGLRGIASSAKDGQLVGDRFRFIGANKKSADIIITIIDEKSNVEIVVSNRITEAGNTITFDAPDNYPLSKDWLNRLFNAAFLSAKHFTSLSSKEQALALGIDTGNIDSKIVNAKSELTITNRAIKDLGHLEPQDPAEKVSVSELVKVLNEINDENKKIETFNDSIISVRTKTDLFKEELIELENKIAEIRGNIEKGEKWLEGREAKPTMPTVSIEQKIRDAEDINEKAEKYKMYKDKSDKLSQLTEVLVTQNKKVEDLQSERLSLITGFNFGIDGLDVDISGALMLNDRPIKDVYYSKGELEIIVAKLYSSTNPELKIRFIDEFATLDEDSQALLVKDLLDKGFQIITSQPGKIAKGENSLLIRDGKAIKEGGII